jgi:hypothetical protein
MFPSMLNESGTITTGEKRTQSQEQQGEAPPLTGPSLRITTEVLTY